MASYVSNQPIQYNQTTSNINLPLEANVLNTLEGRYNQNKAQIQQVLDAYGSIDLLRDEDKEYLAGKLRDVTESINNSGNRNLARSYVAQDILNKAKTVAQDTVVLNAMESTLNKKNYDSQYSEMCKKDPSKCNDLNYEYGLYKAGYNEYMAGKSDKLGSVKVRPYTDFMSNAIKKAKDLKDLKGDQEIEIPNPSKPGGYIKKKISGLTVDEVMNYFPEILSSEEREQMKIDGWGRMKNMDSRMIEQEANVFFNTKLKLLDDVIKEQDSIINGDGYSQSQKDDATRLKQVYQAQKNDYSLLSTQVNKQSPEEVGYLFQKESFNKTAANLFTGRTSITYDDSGYYSMEKLKLDYSAEQRAIEKHNADMAEHNAKMAKDYGLNADGTPKTDTWTQTPEEEQNVGDKTSDYEKARTAYDDSFREIVSTVESVYNNDIVSESNKNKFLTQLKANNYTVKNGKIVSLIPNNTVSKASAAEVAYREARLDVYDANADKIITEASTTRELLLHPLVEAEKGEPVNEPTYTQTYTDPMGGVYETPVGKVPDIKKMSERLQKYDIGSLLPSKYKNVINITQEGDRSRLIQMLPQTIKDTDGNVVATGVGAFNAKNPVTIKKIPDGYVIEQDRGISDSGEDKGKPLQPATTTVYRNSAAYNYIEQHVNTIQSNNISVQSVPKTFSITPIVKPTFVDDNNKDLKNNYINRLITNVNQKTLSEIGSSVTPQGLPLINPAIFLTKEDSKNYFKAILSKKATEEQIDNLLKRVESKFDEYSIKVKPNTNKQNWILEFDSPYSSEKSVKILGGSELHKDYSYMVKTFPQVLILSEIAKELIKNPQQIDKI